jgi:hypothetical protein
MIKHSYITRGVLVSVALLVVSGSLSVGISQLDRKGIDLNVSCSRTSVRPGDTISFYFECTNTADSLITFDMTLWLNREGGARKQYLGPYALPLAGQKRIRRNQNILIPEDVEMGFYVVTLTAKKGYELLDEESFKVKVEKKIPPQ